MASTSSVQEWYKPPNESDVNLLRSMRILYVVRGVMQYVFQQGTKNRPPSQSLLQYFQSKNMRIKKMEKQLFTKDHDGSSFDITMLFKCIKYGCEKVAQEDEVWKEGSDSLESSLTELKNWRNELSHETPRYDEKQFLCKIEKIHCLLTKVLQHAGRRYEIEEKVTEEKIRNVNEIIPRLREESWMPMSFEDYKRLNLYCEKETHVRDEVKICLFNLYTGWVIICPSSLLYKVNFRVEEIYTELILKGEDSHGNRLTQKLENLLEDINHDKDDPVILLEGHAGSGKSTITKKVLRAWVCGDESCIANIKDYDLLLYSEFREQSIKSFSDLVTTLIPELAKSYIVDDLCNTIQNMRTLVILDGFDEMNDSSLFLFKEILELKATKGFTVMVTSRPEAVDEYHTFARINQVKTKHIMISGIAKEKREEFVRKYCMELERMDDAQIDNGGLLEYLSRTAHRLSDLWELPYNLTLLICLWVYKSEIVHSITSSTELHWEIYKLCINKLSERLSLIKATKKSLRDEKIEKFTSFLGQVALKYLGKDKIQLSEDDYGELKKFCGDERLPTEEMTGAFMKTVKIRTRFGFESKYSFPHKSQQEFLAALHIFAEAEKKSTSSGPTDQTFFVREMLRNVSPSDSDIRKYQNLLVTLLGLFHSRRNRIDDSIAAEVLNLLQEAGVKDKYDWLRILDSVKCNAVVANFLSMQHNIFSGETDLGDHNVHAYISLLQAHSSQVEDSDKVTINISVHEKTTPMSTLLNKISEKGFSVQKLELHYEFQNPDARSSSEDAINSVMQRCSVQLYLGILFPHLQLPTSLRYLSVRVATEAAMKTIQLFLQSHNLHFLHIRSSPEMKNMILESLSDVHDLSASSTSSVVNIENTQPTDGLSELPHIAMEASTQPAHAVYKPSDVYFFCSVKLLDEVRRVMCHVFREGTKERLPSQPLLEFIELRRGNRRVFQKCLTSKDKHLIVRDPEGSRFDIPLLFKCIMFGCDGVAHDNDKVWKAGLDCLESFLPELKCFSNDIRYTSRKLHEQEFLIQTERIRDLLTKVLHQAGNRFGIKQTDTDKMIKDMNDNINRVGNMLWILPDTDICKLKNVSLAPVEASTQRVQEEYRISDIHFLRSVKTLEEVRRVMLFVLRAETKDRCPSESLLQYFQRIGVAKRKFSKFEIMSLSDESKLSIPLLFGCIRVSCEVVHGYSDVWMEGDDSLETHLVGLKNWGNELLQELPRFSPKEFFNQTEKVRYMLTKVLKHAGIRYGIPKIEIDMMTNDMNNNITQYRDQFLILLDFDA